MKFSDKKHRDELDTVHVVRTMKEMEGREEYNWQPVKFNTGGYKEGKPLHFFETLARDVKIGEDFYSKKGQWLGYRVE